MTAPIRTFQAKPAIRQSVPLLIGLVGPSGGGKTGSALELAHGIQEVVGGDIYYIDTEARRALHYAGAQTFSDPNRTFNFKHVQFDAPFGPLDYLSAIDYAVKQGARVIVVDSMSHEHEGPGGVLEMHEAELTRIAGDDWAKRDRVKMLAWQKPKAERRALINAILQYPGVNFIFCFRAKEKLKMVRGKEPEPQGWQPIAGEEFVFEMTLNCLLPPGVNGVPEWAPEEKAERSMIKLPQQFRSILTAERPLSIEVGRALALWAEGPNPKASAPKPAPQITHRQRVNSTLVELADRLTAEQRQTLMADFKAAGRDDELLTALELKAKEFCEINAGGPPMEAAQEYEPETEEPGLGIF